MGADGTNGIGTLWTVESTAHSVYNGITLGLVKRYTNNFEFQAFYTLSWDKSDDDNERDPFTLPLREGHRPRPRVRLLEPRPAPPRQRVRPLAGPGRDQRERELAVPVGAAAVASTGRPRSTRASPRLANTPQDRINTDGSVTARNLGRKDNQFNSVNLRISRPFVFGAVTVEPIAEVFNLFNSRNLKDPAYGNLLFNFDGTVQQGLGDPRQAQLGVRVLF